MTAVVPLQQTVVFSEKEIFQSGAAFAQDTPDLEARVSERAEEMRLQFAALYEQLREPPPERGYNLVVERGTPLAPLVATLRALRRTGVTRVTFVSFRSAPLNLWLRPMVHQHACGVPVMLTDDGASSDSFADWPSLLRAADDAQRIFELDVR